MIMINKVLLLLLWKRVGLQRVTNLLEYETLHLDTKRRAPQHGDHGYELAAGSP